MRNIDGISSIKGRIESIKAQFKPEAMKSSSMQQGNFIPFDAAMKQAMGSQNFNQLNAMNGPDSLMALLNNPAFQSQHNNTNTLNEKIAQVAKEWDGKDFKPGQTERCADFVSTMIKDAGAAPPNFQHEVNCLRLQEYGKKIDRKDLKPGDIVYFSNTYLPVDYTHVGIYIGDNKFVHRPTAAKPVRVDDLNGYYGDKYESARRLHG